MKPEESAFRSVVGEFASGLIVVTSHHAGEPVGFTAQSFASLSLDPPLILFCPAKRSLTWPRIREVGAFCVNVLGSAQHEVCQQFAASRRDKFSGVDWAWSEKELPVIQNCLAYIHGELWAVHDAGDHEIAVGRVTDLRLGVRGSPLLFFRGNYSRLAEADIRRELSP